MKAKWCVPCLRGVVGNWVYYSALMTAEQLSARVDVSKNIRESAALEDFLQRTLKDRYTKIAQYLLTRDDHFFNSIILGVFDGLPDWVQFDLNPMAKTLELPEVSEVEESLGLLIFDGQEKMFAIDGQHRVMGIKTAFEKERGKVENDEYSVIFVAHQDDRKGKARTRRLFCDINKNAVAVSEGDKVIIDEDDFCAIVTRRIFAGYAPFKEGKLIAVTDKKEQLAETYATQEEKSDSNREWFTSLLALHTVCKTLKPLLNKPSREIDNSTENIKALQIIVEEFFDFIIEHEPDLNGYFKKNDTTPNAERENNRNLFFKPIGLELLARLYKYCHQSQTLEKLADALATWKFENPNGIWDGIAWRSGKIDASAKARKVAFELCLYFLDEWEDDEALLSSLREIRDNADYELPDKFQVPKR